MELENIYLLGDFQLSPQTKGFSIQEGLGDWGFESGTRNGYPFYSGIVQYSTEVKLQGDERHLSIQLGEWQGSLVEVMIDKKTAKILAWPPYRAEIDLETPGTHLVGVKVVSTPRNLFGPFHHPDKLRMRAWPAAWSDFPEHQPAGNLYDFIDFGLLQKPEITVF
jgi:hypothetical protein